MEHRKSTFYTYILLSNVKADIWYAKSVRKIMGPEFYADRILRDM
jgi:hypothetical protein